MSDIIDRLRAGTGGGKHWMDLHSEAADEIVRLRTDLAAVRADAERLAYVYSGSRTESDALVNIEMRLLNGDVPTMDEVRAAIDAARGGQQ